MAGELYDKNELMKRTELKFGYLLFFNNEREVFEKKYQGLKSGREFMSEIREQATKGKTIANIRLEDNKHVHMMIDDYFIEKIYCSPHDYDQVLGSLIQNQIKTENIIRSKIVGAYVSELGLQDDCEEIFTNINKQVGKESTIGDVKFDETLSFTELLDIRRNTILSESRAALEFSLNYIDKWQDYTRLFK